MSVLRKDERTNDRVLLVVKGVAESLPDRRDGVVFAIDSVRPDTCFGAILYVQDVVADRLRWPPFTLRRWLESPLRHHARNIVSYERLSGRRAFQRHKDGLAAKNPGLGIFVFVAIVWNGHKW